VTWTPAHEHPNSIAIIGMAARLPGAHTIDEFWWNLREGVESITRHSREEMLANGARPGLVDDPYYVNASASLDQGFCFDAEFFGYSSREASIIDPQHRIFLECSYHALEDAAYDSARYAGLIGIFGGSTMNTYILNNVVPRAADVVALLGDLQIMVGNDKDYLTTRVSHKLDLRGPSIAVQTACSTSLVAVHMACRALIDDECDIALAGGSSMRMPHAAGYLANPGGTSSADGHCRAFDADASGSVVGSGVGVVVLRRLADAVRDGDQIHAIIRGTAVNNDGRAKASFTAPSINGQARVIEQAVKRAGVSARDISLVEAHGTGTPLGDPIEVAALTSAFRLWTEDTGYCWLGSAKPNIGHLDAAAGVAGLIKTVLSIKHRAVPPLVNFSHPSPKLSIESTPFKIAADLVPLEPETDKPVLASVNSLAMGGTNAHVILEEAPPAPKTEPSGRQRHPILLSARSPEALDELGRSLGQWARENPTVPLADVAHTLATGRREHEFRRVVHATDLEDVASALSARGSRRQRDSHVRGSVRAAFLFPGQGEQFPGMGELALREPVLARYLDLVTGMFAERSGIDLHPLLYTAADEQDQARAALRNTALAQAALFAVEWATGRMLLDFGIRPYAMLGHSVGELVGAALGGVLDIEAAVDLLTTRGKLMADTAEGAMLYANLSEDELAARLPDSGLAVAAVNADRLVVVSGATDDVNTFESRLRSEGVTCGRMDVTRAFHSGLMDQAAARFRKAAGDHNLTEPDCLLVSNVTGRYLTTQEATSPDYWASQLRQTVRFADGLDLLVRDGVTVFFEVGPGHVLSKLALAARADAVRIALIGAEQDARKPDLLDALTSYWIAGGEVDWSAWYADERRARISLPPYPFARIRHWLEPRSITQAPATVHEPKPEAQVPRGFDGTPMQRYVAWLWRGLLDSSGFGLHDSFFEVGGTSLIAMQMISELRKHGADSLEMNDFFESPTVAGLAVRLEELGMRPPQYEQQSAVLTAGKQASSTPSADIKLASADGLDADELAALVAEVESLSDDEVRARLAELDGEEDA
jgi:phthiocerol/phenolphthiocerol synthesis type-I polyketide synthase E